MPMLQPIFCAVTSFNLFGNGTAYPRVSETVAHDQLGGSRPNVWWVLGWVLPSTGALQMQLKATLGLHKPPEAAGSDLWLLPEACGGLVCRWVVVAWSLRTPGLPYYGCMIDRTISRRCSWTGPVRSGSRIPWTTLLSWAQISWVSTRAGSLSSSLCSTSLIHPSLLLGVLPFLPIVQKVSLASAWWEIVFLNKPHPINKLYSIIMASRVGQVWHWPRIHV